MIKLRNKNKNSFQSCRYCQIGGSLYRIDSDEGVFYVCEKHCEEKDFLKSLLNEGDEEEFLEKVGLLTRAINYIKGG